MPFPQLQRTTKTLQDSQEDLHDRYRRRSEECDRYVTRLITLPLYIHVFLYFQTETVTGDCRCCLIFRNRRLLFMHYPSISSSNSFPIQPAIVAP